MYFARRSDLNGDGVVNFESPATSFSVGSM